MCRVEKKGLIHNGSEIKPKTHLHVCDIKFDIWPVARGVLFSLRICEMRDARHEK